jgi:hypothetical protein
MGYRALLKKYLATIEEETGSLHLDRLEARPDERFSKRDLGELRALAAELCREGTPRRRPRQALWHARGIDDESGTPHDHQHRND